MSHFQNMTPNFSVQQNLKRQQMRDCLSKARLLSSQFVMKKKYRKQSAKPEERHCGQLITVISFLSLTTLVVMLLFCPSTQSPHSNISVSLDSWCNFSYQSKFQSIILQPVASGKKWRQLKSSPFIHLHQTCH